MNRSPSRLRLAALLALVAAGPVASPADPAAHVWTPDNGNGAYTNPLMWADWPDPDVIRVDDNFYFVSTSMHYVPGCPIAVSKDLVNWQMAGYAIQRYDEDPRYDMLSGQNYLNGSWAATIRHHGGLFYVGFCTPHGIGKKDGQFSMCTAKDVKGPWTRTIFPEKLYDPGLLFDDDGRVYVAHGQGTLYVTELRSDALATKVARKMVFPADRKRPYLEGSHFYKVNGKYYILATTGGGGKGGEVCLRSDQVYGPYEYKLVMDSRTTSKDALHQGGMVQLRDGSWWFIIMENDGPLGRRPNLEPVTWEDGWPILGEGRQGCRYLFQTRRGRDVSHRRACDHRRVQRARPGPAMAVEPQSRSGELVPRPARRLHAPDGRQSRRSPARTHATR